MEKLKKLNVQQFESLDIANRILAQNVYPPLIKKIEEICLRPKIKPYTVIYTL